MQRRASCSTEHPHAGLAHPIVGPCHRQDSTAGLCFVFHGHTHIYTHTHTAGNLPSETKPAKQSCKHQIRPSPFHPTPERTFAHGFTSKVATPRWLQLLHELDGAAPVSSRPTLTHPGFKRAFYQKAIDMPHKCLSPTCLLLKRWQGARSIHPPRLQASWSRSMDRNLGLEWEIMFWENNHCF